MGVKRTGGWIEWGELLLGARLSTGIAVIVIAVDVRYVFCKFMVSFRVAFMRFIGYWMD